VDRTTMKRLLVLAAWVAGIVLLTETLDRHMKGLIPPEIYIALAVFGCVGVLWMITRFIAFSAKRRDEADRIARQYFED
jgi:hypothetical protein